MTTMQQRLASHKAKQEHKQGAFFKIEENKDVYFRILPDGNKKNELFFEQYVGYKLNDQTYVNYPDRNNSYHEVLNKIYQSGPIGQSVYSGKKGGERHCINVLSCEKDGLVLDTEVKVLNISSKKLWDAIEVELNTNDFIDDATTYFKVKRTGKAVATTYTLQALHGEEIDFDDYELPSLVDTLKYDTSDAKAEPFKQELIKQFNL